MKKTVLLFAFFFTTISFSQIGHEHTFYEGTISRIALENLGEKYYLYDRGNSCINLYNADYSLWKTISITVPAGTYWVVIRHVSLTKINADNHIEISYTASGSTSPQLPQSRIINDLGAVLMSADNCDSLKIDEHEDFQTKIIATSEGSVTVYSVPELLPEHTFTEASIDRIKLENSGEKYYSLDRLNSLVNLYNPDYSLWKTISLPKPDGATLSGIGFLSEHQINSDNLIEVGYGYYMPGINATSESKIINENGIVITTLANTSNFWINSIEGLSNKLIVDTSHDNGVDPYIIYETQIYSIPGFTLEHTYSGMATRTKLENSGEKYYIVNYNPETFEIVVYNSNHTAWKTVSVPINNPYETINDVSISELLIGPNSDFKIAYTIHSNTLDGGHFLTNIVSEDGAILLSANEANYGFMSVLPNLPNKFITHTSIWSLSNTQIFSSVYGEEGSFAVNEFNKSKISIAPNPAQNAINLLSKTTIVEADIFDIRGIRISQSKGTDIKMINVENLSSGMYLLQLNDTYGVKSTHKIVVSH